ncbi:MAG: extracellular solute-binding protein [Candidatus Korarchaeota archaeon]|nr:extracellular solute-binding protein [Candidatus Korarchaeota archaeon]NIU84498.1 extracellular solute-binding protein [Candidatus Thorarchaeota archaeon]NIW14565.1 extracellular solute-binding protein [Candidatus Thorarchaeota archaeon]NIW52637.1 extracellular solute-binding protein [Candidatus Korarchaeota archaeon]
MRKSQALIAIVLIGIVIDSTVAIGWRFGWFAEEKEELYVIHAGSLSVPFDKMETEYEEKYPNIDVRREAYGSRLSTMMVRNSTKEYDILGVADYHLIPDLLYPDKATWTGIVASNQMCLAYTDKAKYSEEINSTNWYQILNRSDVSYAHSDKDLDPCGYRSIIVYRLASAYYGKPIFQWLNGKDQEKIYQKETDIVTDLQTGETDYGFEYLSIAKQHKLSYVKFPDRINLGNWNYADYYKENGYVVLTDGTNITGVPILYGITIPETYQNYDATLKWVQMVAGETGRNIFDACGQPPLNPALTPDSSAIPEELAEYFEEEQDLP